MNDTPDLSQEHAPDSQGEPLPVRRDDAVCERPHHNATCASTLAAGTGREREANDLLAAAVCLEELVEREGPLQAEVSAIWRRLTQLAREAGGDA